MRLPRLPKRSRGEVVLEGGLTGKENSVSAALQSTLRPWVAGAGFLMMMQTTDKKNRERSLPHRRAPGSMVASARRTDASGPHLRRQGCFLPESCAPWPEFSKICCE